MNTNLSYYKKYPQYLSSAEYLSAGVSFAELEGAYEKLPWSSINNVCDLMSGTGLTSGHLLSIYRNKITSLTLIDLNPACLDYAKREGVVGSFSHVKYQCTDIKELSGVVDSTRFDLIVCRIGMNNLEQSEYSKAVEKIVQSLSFRGHLVLQDHFALGAAEQKAINTLEEKVALLDGRDTKPWIPTLIELGDYFESAGCPIVNTKEFPEPFYFSLKERFVAKGFEGENLQKALYELGECVGSLSPLCPQIKKLNGKIGDVLVAYHGVTVTLRRLENK